MICFTKPPPSFFFLFLPLCVSLSLPPPPPPLPYVCAAGQTCDVDRADGLRALSRQGSDVTDHPDFCSSGWGVSALQEYRSTRTYSPCGPLSQVGKRLEGLLSTEVAWVELGLATGFCVSGLSMSLTFACMFLLCVCVCGAA